MAALEEAMGERGEAAKALKTAAAESAKAKLDNYERPGLKTLEQVMMLWRAAGCVPHERVLGGADKYGLLRVCGCCTGRERTPTQTRSNRLKSRLRTATICTSCRDSKSYHQVV